MSTHCQANDTDDFIDNSPIKLPGGRGEGREGGAELMGHQGETAKVRLAAAWQTCEVKASGEANDLLVFRHGWIRIEPWHGQQFSYTSPTAVHYQSKYGTWRFNGASMWLHVLLLRTD